MAEMQNTQLPIRQPEGSGDAESNPNHQHGSQVRFSSRTEEIQPSQSSTSLAPSAASSKLHDQSPALEGVKPEAQEELRSLASHMRDGKAQEPRLPNSTNPSGSDNPETVCVLTISLSGDIAVANQLATSLGLLPCVKRLQRKGRHWVHWTAPSPWLAAWTPFSSSNPGRIAVTRGQVERRIKFYC